MRNDVNSNTGYNWSLKDPDGNTINIHISVGNLKTEPKHLPYVQRLVDYVNEILTDGPVFKVEDFVESVNINKVTEY